MKDEQIAEKPTRSDEMLVFFILAFVLVPALAIGTVGGYGFIVWMIQLIQGPPGAP